MLRPGSSAWRTAFRWAAGSLAVFLVAEFVSRLELVPPVYLPYASTILLEVPVLLGDPAFLAHLAATLAAWAVALGVAILISVPVGIALGSSEAAFQIAAPVVNLMRPIPSVCLLPLALVVLGTGFSMKIVLVSYATVWPILFNTIYGVHNVDPVTVQTGRCFGLGRMAVIRRISLPSAAPFIFTGIRISGSIGLVVLVSSELLTDSTHGIGSFIMQSSSGGGHMHEVFAAAVIAGLLGLLINAGLGGFDKYKFAWRYSSGRAA